MRKLIALALFVAFASTPAAQRTDRVFPFDYRSVTLDNGLKAYFIKAGSPGQVAYYSMVRTGSRDEVEPGRTGFAHFFEHMMFRGTKKYPDFGAETSRMGAARNGFTSADRTVYFLVAGTEHLERIVDLESDRFQNLVYSESDFRTEAGAVLGEYQQSATTPGGFLNERTVETAFDRHTYRHTTIGYEADVRAMPDGFEYSKDFYRRHYRPENVVLVVVGDFDDREAERLIRRYYGNWQPGYVPPDIPVEPAQTAPRRRTIEYPGRTLPILRVAYRGPAWNAADRVAVATEVLGALAFGPTSDINKRLVLDERKVQNIGGSFGLLRDPGLLAITTTVIDPADLERVEQEIQRTIERFQREPVDARVLADVKSNMKYGFLMGLETAQNVALSVMSSVTFTGGIEAVETYYRTLDAVTPDDVREAARRYLVDTGKTVITMVQAGGGR